MTNDEKIQRAERLIAEANTLLNEVKANSSDGEDMIAKYKNDYCKDRKYYLNNQSNIDYINYGDSFEKVEGLSQSPYQHYLTEELAEQAKELKDFNDRLLAFKYCYDRDYKPDLHNLNSGRWWFVYFDIGVGVYKCLWDNDKMNVVYFSSKEIAQKCCDWLNSLSD